VFHLFSRAGPLGRFPAKKLVGGTMEHIRQPDERIRQGLVGAFFPFAHRRDVYAQGVGQLRLGHPGPLPKFCDPQNHTSLLLIFFPAYGKVKLI